MRFPTGHRSKLGALVARRGPFLLLVLLLTLAACSPGTTGETPATQPTVEGQLPTTAPTAPPPTAEPATPTQEPTLQSTPTAEATPTTTTPPTATSQPGQPLQIGRLYMMDASSGWATGRLQGAAADRILFTSDGGHAWQDRTPSDAPAQSGDQSAGIPEEISTTAYFTVQPNPAGPDGWVSYSRPRAQAAEVAPRVWATGDRGQTWQAGSPLDLSGMPFDFFLPSNLGFLEGRFGWLLAHLGAGMSHDYVAIFTTSDGGQTWQRVADPQANPGIQACQKPALVFTNEREGWLAGNCPGLMPPLFLYRSGDGGATWSQATLPPPPGLPDADAGNLGDRCGIPQMALVAPGTLMLNLQCRDFQQDTVQTWLYVTGDGRLGWQIHSLPAPSAILHFISPQEGWLLGSDPAQAEAPQQVMHTTDGGATWDALAQVPGQGQLQLSFADTQNGWIVTGYMGEGQRTLWRTSDGGQNWQEVAPTLSP